MSEVELFALIDSVTNEMLNLETAGSQLMDSTISADLDQMTIEFSMDVLSEDESTAKSLSLAFVHKAIHAAGGQTPGWDDASSSGNPDSSSADFRKPDLVHCA